MWHPYMYAWNFSSPNTTTDKHSRSILAYLVSTSVRVLEANAMGLLSCMRAAPSPYSLASVCISIGFVCSHKYAKVVLSRVLQIHCLSR